jgi:hypothetical protein
MIMKKLLWTLGFAVVATPVLANDIPFAIPEIDALAGVAALAVVGATVALIRERNKR